MRLCHPASHASAPQCNTGNWKQKAVPQSLDEDFLLHQIFPALPIRSWEQRFKLAHWILVCGMPHLPEKPNSAATCAFHGSNEVKTFASHSRFHQTYSPTAISLGRKLCLHFIVGMHFVTTCQPPPPGSVPRVKKMFEWLVPNVILEKNCAPKN